MTTTQSINTVVKKGPDSPFFQIHDMIWISYVQIQKLLLPEISFCFNFV